MKQLKILIPNGSSPKNLGDLAILSELISLIKVSFPNSQIVLHTFDKKLHFFRDVEIKDSLYSRSIFKTTSPVLRLFSTVDLFFSLVLYSCGIKFSFDKDIRELIYDYSSSDVIFFCGGGYLRSQSGLTQFLNLFMILVVFAFGIVSGAKTVMAPASFGPFAYGWQSRLAVIVLEKFDVVMLREVLSYECLKKLKLDNIFLSTDLALFLAKKTKLLVNKTTNIRKKELLVGFTIRNWLPSAKQYKLEQSYLKCLYKLSKEYKLTVQPIVQVSSIDYGDKDLTITQSIAKELSNLNIKVNKVIIPNSLNQALVTYSMLDFLIGMRMHSTIFAAISGIPFVAVSYEYKMDGFASQVDMEDYLISCVDVTENLLYKLAKKLIKNKLIVSKSLSARLKDINKQGNIDWKNIIQTKLLDTKTSDDKFAHIV